MCHLPGIGNFSLQILFKLSEYSHQWVNICIYAWTSANTSKCSLATELPTSQGNAIKLSMDQEYLTHFWASNPRPRGLNTMIYQTCHQQYNDNTQP